MQLCKLRDELGHSKVGLVRNSQVFTLNLERMQGVRSLSDILFATEPARTIQLLVDDRLTTFPFESKHAQAPVDQQEIWAAGVTYKRSKQARETESAGAATFYDKVYTAERPELFLKATAARVVGPWGTVRVRQDSRWTVPEPELAVFVSPDLRIVGYSIGNDMSARDIEGENPLYLPQAKIYKQSCAIGPLVTLPQSMPAAELQRIDLKIERNERLVFHGHTFRTEMARSLESLVEWLGRDNSFPNGAVLLTGTGVVPPDDFTLATGDKITIEITGVGKLINVVG
ncbi:MAG TPA: fumarylacetoacetate hydrolase family protein [Gemmataceae bacterium]|jgi:2-dehydro-3-deoxy-D-arabinonate dehydratase|nr:fumarylacetoacetate hydrolase family protein [Gemmataceae bacterium]